MDRFDMPPASRRRKFRKRWLLLPWAFGALLMTGLAGKAALADTAAGLAYMKRGAYFRAMTEFEDPAKAGDPVAQANLGAIYYYGLGVPADFTRSAYWYHAAALKGNVDAQLGLAILYTTGQGVAPSFPIAHMWLAIAADAMPPSPDRVRVTEDMKALASKMSPGEVAQSKSLVEAWYKSHTAP
jgi:TPR repeat protein